VTQAPGPKGHFLLGSLPAARRDPLQMIRDAVSAHGDVVRLKMGPGAVHLLRHPDHLKLVLQEQTKSFSKNTRAFRNIRLLIPNGLLTSEGEHWLRQRRIAQPAFHKQRIAGFGATIARAAQDLVASWRDGATVALFDELMRVTLRMVCETLLGVAPGEDTEEVEGALTDLLHFIRDRGFQPFPLPVSWPTAANRRFHRARRTLDRIVYRVIAERRGRGREDLVSMLLAARDEETGAAMSDEQVRDEVLTIFLAGHETTATALAWTLWLVARAPEVAARLHAEVDALRGPPTFDDLSRLPYARQIVDESMRLYPPVWMVARRAEERVTIGGYEIPPQTLVLLSIYALHRHPEFWERPDSFEPARFATPPPRWAYLPFGGGPRGCIGNGFALVETLLTLATVAQRFRLEALEDPVPEPLITLRPRGGVRVRLHAR
jgi:cytochrome P450